MLAPVPLALTVAVELGGTVTFVPLVVVTTAGALDVDTVAPLTTGQVGTEEGVVTPLILTGCLLVTVATRDCDHAVPAARMHRNTALRTSYLRLQELFYDCGVSKSMDRYL